MRRYLTITIAAAAVAILPQAVRGQNHHASNGMKTSTPATLKWAPMPVEGFPPGMEMAVLEGDPSVANQPFAVRVRFPDGYRMPAHYHPTAENITVMSGTFLLKMGDTATQNADSYAPGDFISIPPLQPHYGGAKGVTVVQVHGIGPFKVLLAKPGSTPGK